MDKWAWVSSCVTSREFRSIMALEEKENKKKKSSPKNWRNLRGKSDWVSFYRLLPSQGSPRQECLLYGMQNSVHQVWVSCCYLFSHRLAFLGCHGSSPLGLSASLLVSGFPKKAKWGLRQALNTYTIWGKDKELSLIIAVLQ